MKKLIIILTVVIAICAMSISTLAARGGFIESPSANGAPTIVEDNTDDRVMITAYRDRKEALSAEQIVNFDNAYKSALSFSSVSHMNSKITGHASALKVNVSDLALSDFFYVTIDGNKASAMVSLKSVNFSNFVCLLRYDGSNWVVVDAELNGDNIIEFLAVPGAYAVVVSTGATPDYDSYKANKILTTVLIIAAVVAAVLLSIFFIFFILGKKKKEEEETPTPVVAPPTGKNRRKRKKKKNIVGDNKRKKNRQRKKKRDKNRNKKRKKHGK